MPAQPASPKNGVTVSDDGTKIWYRDGKRHRDDGPAIEQPDGTKMWLVNDDFHRIGGPAIDYANGTKRWYQNSKLHREDGPAIEWHTGDKEWYINDKRHREDGPAVVSSDRSEWWVEGKRITEVEFMRRFGAQIARSQKEAADKAERRQAKSAEAIRDRLKKNGGRFKL